MEIILKEEENKTSLIAKIVGGSVPIKTVVEQDLKLERAKSLCGEPKDQKGQEIERDLDKIDVVEYNFWIDKISKFLISHICAKTSI